MSSVVLPPDSSHFTCFQAYPLPGIETLQEPGKTCRRLYPEKYFRDWKHDPVRERRPYFWSEFQRLMDLFEPVEVANISSAETAYCWKAKTPITWADAYRHFPQHSPKKRAKPVIPWYRLQQLVLGWENLKGAIIPSNETGALVPMGDEGVAHAVLGSDPAPGTVKVLVQIGYYMTVRSPAWNFNVPAKEAVDWMLCPPDMVFVTVH